MSSMSRERKGSNWGKPSKGKVAKVVKSLASNPTPSAGGADDSGQTRAGLSALRAKNQTSTPGRAQGMIKRRRA
jgi:hypothetical protein